MRAPALDSPSLKRPPGRRARLRWTIRLLAAAAVLGTVIGTIAWWKSRPAEYRPGEEDAAITRDLDRSIPAEAPRPEFADVTASAGLSQFRAFSGARTSQLPEDMGGGAAWGDYDNDGDDDLFLVSNGGPLDVPAAQLAPSMLFRNRGDGTFERAAGFEEPRIVGMGAAWGDYDNDGRLDLAVTGYNALLLFHNDNGALVRVAQFPSREGFWTGPSWGDFDRDGRLDLYVCGYVRYAPPKPEDRTKASEQFGLAVPYTLNPSSYEAERNLLFHNEGGGRFQEVAARLGVDNPQGRSLSALWHDFDQDGWLDIYVANDISESKFFLNRRGRFEDAGQGAWVSEYRGSMGLAAGDWDRDGDDDLFISHWIAQQYALYNSLLADNRKLKGAAALHFMDVAEMRGIGQPSLRSIGWGTEFADFDADGWLDLAVANGSTFEEKGRLLPMRSFLFWNQQGKFFHDLAPASKTLSAEHVSRGLAVSDYDRDGDLDLAVVDLDGGVRLLRNDMRQGRWAQFRGLPPGTTLAARAGGVELRRTVGGASYLSQSTRTVHFGLGTAERIDSLEVRWPDGKVDTHRNLDANRAWDLTLIAFWEKQRAAMNAMKVEGDVGKAVRLFRDALALNPGHEDSLYYLGNCLAAQGDAAGARESFARLVRLNAHSQRGHSALGLLDARANRYQAARQSLERALAINPEETGALMALGEVELALGRPNEAARRFELAARTNPRAAGARFLQAYIAWRAGDSESARQMLLAARQARGPEWKPKGTVAEGDVRRRMHVEGTLLSRFWEEWDGTVEPRLAFAPLQRALSR
jgi:tetratricopeptide (TPR) repeat protein